MFDNPCPFTVFSSQKNIQNLFNFMCDNKEMAPFSDISNKLFLYLINKLQTSDGIHCSMYLIGLCCPVIICCLMYFFPSFFMWRITKRYQSICTSNTYLRRSEWGHNWTGSSSVWLGGTQETGAVSHTARWLWCGTTCRT